MTSLNKARLEIQRNNWIISLVAERLHLKNRQEEFDAKLCVTCNGRGKIRQRIKCPSCDSNGKIKGVIYVPIEYKNRLPEYLNKIKNEK